MVKDIFFFFLETMVKDVIIPVKVIIIFFFLMWELNYLRAYYWSKYRPSYLNIFIDQVIFAL